MLLKDGKKTDWVNIDLQECLKGNALDAFYTLKIFNHLESELEQKKLDKLYQKLIVPLTPILLEMEYNGLLIDESKLESLDKRMKAKIADIEDKMRESAGDFNFESSADLIKILFSLEKNKDTKDWNVVEGGFGIFPFAFTAKGQPSTDDETLVLLKELIDKEYHKREQ